MDFKIKYPTEITDIDYMGHVSHYKWFEIMERTRFSMLESIGWPLSKAWELGVGAVVSNAQIDFMRPSKYGDVLEVTISPCEPFEYGCVLHYKISNQKGRPCIDCKQTIYFVDLKNKSKTATPAELSSKLGF